VQARHLLAGLQDNNDSRIVYYFQFKWSYCNQPGDYANNNAAYQAAPTFRDVDHTEATDPVEFFHVQNLISCGRS